MARMPDSASPPNVPRSGRDGTLSYRVPDGRR